MPVPLPQEFVAVPLAHRALHDLELGLPENSREAVDAAVAEGWGIEIDVQLSRDRKAMVFHDPHLGRLTAERGRVRRKTAEALGGHRLRGGASGIPTLPEILARVGGRVPLLIEIKDQDGALGTRVGALEAAVADALDGYRGPVAVMSFNPESVAVMHLLAPRVPRGLTTGAFDSPRARLMPPARKRRLRAIADFDRVGASFISHDRRHLDVGPVHALKERGVPVLCWTVRTPAEERAARRIADNITFEGYRPERA